MSMPNLHRSLMLLCTVLLLAAAGCTRTSEKPPTLAPATSRPLTVVTATAPAGAAAVPCVTPAATVAATGTPAAGGPLGALGTATATGTPGLLGTPVASGTPGTPTAPVPTLTAGVPCPTPGGLGALAGGTAAAGATPGGAGTPSASGSATPQASATPAAGSAGTYTVKAGDSLGAIAASLGFSTQDLIAANPGIDPNVILVGQVLKLPAAGGTPRAATATPAAGATATATTRPATGTAAASTPQSSGATSGQSYSVQAGDTACKIAAQYKVTIEQLATANNTTVSALAVITPGQTLRIPASTGGAGGC